MTIAEILNGLQSQMIGQRIQIHDQAESTNDLALQHGVDGAPEGTLILAELQTAGRGRHSRTWRAPYGSSILASIVLRHRLLSNQIGLPGLIGAVSIAAAIRELTDLPACIKWPNDVYIHGKKVSGVLTELAYDRRRRPFWVMGFGVNVNTAPDDFPSTLRASATSLRIESGREISRVALLQVVLRELEGNYLMLKRDETASIIEAANARSAPTGRRVHIKTADRIFKGTAERIDSDGGLVLRDKNGDACKFLIGEVVHTET